MHFMLFYHSNENNDNTISLCNLLQEIYETNSSYILITGDFNFPEINWLDCHSNAAPGHR